MNHRLRIVFLIFFFVSELPAIQIHKIRKGESLSLIAERYVGVPIYLKNGSLEKLLSWNPHITNPNIIIVGQKVIVDPSTEYQEDILKESEELVGEKNLNKQTRMELNENLSSFLKVDFSLGTSYFSVFSQAKSNSKSIYFYSEPSVDVAGRLHFHWQENIQSLVGASFSITRFLHNGSQAVENQQASKLSLFTGIKKSWDRISFGSNIIYAQNFFVKNRNQTTLEIVKNPTINFSIQGSYVALRNSKFSFSPGFELQTIIPVDFLEYSYNKGDKWKVLLKHSRDFTKSNVDLTLFYSEEKYETQELRQKERQLSVVVNYQF